MSTPDLSEDRPEVEVSMGRKGGMGLIRHTRLGGPMPWVIAILIALVVIAAAGALSFQNLASNARAELSGAATVQVVEANAGVREQRTEAVAQALGNHPLVTSVRVVPEGELAEMLEPWLGTNVDAGDVPIPALIDVELNRRANAAEIASLQAAIDTVAPGVRVDAQSEALRPVYDALTAVQYLAIVLIALIAFATAAAVWLAARNAFVTHRDTVEVVHLLGGTDRQVTAMFQRVVLRDAAFGGLVGLVLGVAAVWLLGTQFASLDSGMVGGGGLDWTDWALLAAIPLAGVLLALITGRITISFALRSML